MKLAKLTYVCSVILSLEGATCCQNKWIVVTTIQYPTAQLKKLASIPDWRLVVIGDKKTPTDWHLDNCDYLSPDAQLSLGYKLALLLPWNHYGRKNIGYLYAIAHGATLIYDTNADNEPIDGLHPLSNFETLPVLRSNDICVNIYHYFGQPAVWPRGYPLNLIHASHLYIIDKPQRHEIGIEQCMVDSDPDVDAIYRLTHTGPVFFTPQSSCSISGSNFCPFNSQNTFIHKKAFFTLYLPSFVSMRVSDIWRGYIAQKLIRFMHLTLGFSSANAIQLRNNHDLMHDFKLEQDLYFKSMGLITFLDQWAIEDVSGPFQNMKQLLTDLIRENFLQAEELPLCNAWFEDLEAIGYKPLS